MTYLSAADTVASGARARIAHRWQYPPSVSASDAHALRLAGISPALAGDLLRGSFPLVHVTALGRAYSNLGIQALLDSGRLHLRTDLLGWVEAAQRSLPRARAWVHRTDATAGTVSQFDAWEVRPSVVADWCAAADENDSARAAYLALMTGQVLHRLPVTDLAGWLAVAARHGWAYPGDDAAAAGHFLGGPSALCAAAGLTPAEADAAASAGPIDLAGLRTLAALRNDR